MASDRLPFFLALARDWWEVADVLRANGTPPDDPALTVWREAAWCYVLFAAGKDTAALPRLRAVIHAVTGAPPDPNRQPTSQSEALGVAADLFARLQEAVSARHPAAFGPPVAA